MGYMLSRQFAASKPIRGPLSVPKLGKLRSPIRRSNIAGNEQLPSESRSKGAVKEEEAFVGGPVPDFLVSFVC